VLNVSWSLASVFTLRARKNKKPANFVPQIETAADETNILGQLAENKVGKEARTKAPVPNKSR
jgi:hypothetical protein